MKKLFSPVSEIYNRILLDSEGTRFCRLFNLRAAIKGRDVRFSYDMRERMYFAKSEEFQLCFQHTQQANLAYRSGLRSRGSSLAKSYFLDEIDIRSGDLIIDCGANVGDLKLYFRTRGIDVEYVGIEPSPIEYQCLRRNVAPSETHNLGLWDSPGHLEFYVSSSNADSSLIRPPHFDSIIRVETKRLDELISRKVKLLKLEAEGAEPEVLRGAERLLPNIQYITADLGFERGVEQASTLVPVINFLLQRDFELVAISHRRVNALFRNLKAARVSSQTHQR